MTEEIKVKNNVDPVTPGYIRILIANIQRKKLRTLEEIHRLQGQVSGYDAVLRQISFDTERALTNVQVPIDIKEQKQVINEATEDFKEAEKQKKANSLKGVTVRPKKQKQRGPSSIEKLAPPIEGEVLIKPKNKKKKKKNKG